MLPPGMLERLELMAEWLPPGGSRAGDEAAAAPPKGPAPGRRPSSSPRGRIGAGSPDGPRPVRDLEGGGRAATLLRDLRAMASRGLINLEWTLTAATAGPRFERWLLLTEEGRRVAPGGAGGRRPRGWGRGSGRSWPTSWRRRGGRARRAWRRPSASRRHGSGTVTSLVRRGLAAVEVTRAAAPAAGAAAGRPARHASRGSGPDAVRSRRRCRRSSPPPRDRDPTPLLLEGVTGSGKTAVYAEAIAETISTGRPALVLVPEIALAMPLVDRLRAELEAEIAILHSGLGEGERADEWRRIQAGEVDVVVGHAIALTAPLADVGLIVVDEEHDAAYKSDRTPRLQARDAALALARLAGAAVVLGSATPSVESVGRVSPGALPPRRPARTAPAARRRASRWWICARSWPPATAACSRARSGRPSSRCRRASGRSWSSTAAAPPRSWSAATAATSSAAPNASAASSTTRPG